MEQSSSSSRQVVAELEDTLLSSAADRAGVRVVGHRGSLGAGRRENSVAAVTEALRLGADGVEVDVWLTAGGTLVCAHDPIHLLPAAAQDSLATLPEVLAAVQGSAGSRVVVEAKPVADPVLAERTARALADVLAAAAVDAAITVSSFDPVLLGMVREACADLPVRTALLGDAATPAQAVLRRAHEGGHDEVHLPLAGLRHAPQVVTTARWLGLSVTCWTVNRREDLRWVAGLGVDAVITDDVLTAWSELDRTALPELVAA